MTTEQSIFINATPEKIFSYLIDVKNRKSYIPKLEDVLMLTNGPIQKGSRYIEVAQIAGRKLETTYEVIAFEENKHTSAKTIKSIFPIQADLNLEKKDKGTELTIRLEFTLTGIFRIGSSVVKGIVNQQAAGILQKIKENLET